MTAREWRMKARAAQAEELTLPSGMVIQARRPGPLKLAEWNKLPMLLADAGPGGGGLSDEQAREAAAFLREVLIYCCVSPQLSETAPDDAEDEMRPSELPDADFTYIVAWAMRLKEAEAVRPFRTERKDDRTDGDGKTVLTETIVAAGGDGPGAGTGDRPGGGAEGAGIAGERG